MANTVQSESILRDAFVEEGVFKLRPDYRALLMVVDGIPPGPSDDASETILKEAEAAAKSALAKQAVNDIPHVAAWRDAYKAFGAKPKATRNSLEALMRRVENGLPRVNRLTDIYNAISIKHQIPLGGEDLDKYVGAPFLIRSTGKESFVTTAAVEPVTEHPPTGEVVWCDGEGVTCRRWNWRQCSRTALTDGTTRVLFILDALDAVSDEALASAADELGHHLKGLSPEVQIVQRVLCAATK